MRKIICPICGESTNEGKFCSECGALLKQEQPKEKVEEKNKLSNNGFGLLLDKVNLNSTVDEVVNTSVSDAGLKLLIDYCTRTVATVGGDGYQEYVLYQRDEDCYELHYYSKYEYMSKETHLAYKSSKEIVEEAYKRIDELNIDSYQNASGEGLCGGERILKYLRDDKFIRITTGNLPFDKHGILNEISSIICQSANEQNQLL